MSDGSDLEALLTRWRRSPHPVLADAIDIVSERSRLPAFTGSRKAQAAEASLAIPRSVDASLPSILDAIEGQRSIGVAMEAVRDLLASWPPDPRLTTVFLRWLDQAPWTSSGSLKVWRRVFKILDATPDSRVHRVSRLVPERSFPGRSSAFIADHVGRLLERHFLEPSATADEFATWNGILDQAAEAAQRRTEARARLDDLRAAVHRVPTDVGARMVYADALCELGDPRGEFMMLQLSEGLDRTSRTRMNRLRTDHEANWLGPLHPVLNRSERSWAGGYLIGGCIKPKSQVAVDLALGHPEWSLVQSLELRSIEGIGVRGFELVTQPATRALQEIKGITDANELATVLDNPHRKPLTAIGLGHGGWGGVQDETGSMPTQLSVRTLERLELTCAWSEWLSWLAGAFDRVGRVVLMGGMAHRPSRRQLPPVDLLGLLPLLEAISGEVEVTIAGDKGALLTARKGFKNPQYTVQIPTLPRRRDHREALLAGLAAMSARVGEVHIDAADEDEVRRVFSGVVLKT